MTRQDVIDELGLDPDDPEVIAKFEQDEATCNCDLDDQCFNLTCREENDRQRRYYMRPVKEQTMTPEERREAQVRAIANTTSKRDRDIASEHLRDLLAYFDEQEPAVADAIRFGLLGAIDTGHVGYAINYPKGHPKNP